MVKTIPLVIGAAVITTAILILYNISQPSDTFVRFFRFNLTNNDRTLVADHKSLVQELHVRPLSQKPNSLADKMFQKELSRITNNLKSGNIADFDPDPPSVLYVDSHDAKISGYAQAFQDLQNNIANLQQNDYGNYHQVNHNLNIMQLPKVPDNNQNNVYQPAQILNVPKNENNQHIQLNNQHTNQNQPSKSTNAPVIQSNQNVVPQNSQNVPVPQVQNNQNIPVQQNNQNVVPQNVPVQLNNQNVPLQNSPVQHGWKIVNPVHNNQLIQRPPDQDIYGPHDQGAWQPMNAPSQQSQLSDIVQQADAENSGT